MPHAAATRSGPPRPTIGSWPGRESDHNRFQRILLDALEAEGARIVSFRDSRAIRLAGLDVLLLHWPDRIFGEARNAGEASALILRLLAKLAARPRGVKVVWIVHNIRPHDSRGFKRLSWPAYAAALSRVADGALTLSEGTLPAVRTAYPGLARKALDHFWHPFYAGEEIAPEARGAERASLGWSDAGIVYGYCGQLRPYKGVEDLVTAFRALPDPAARLLVAGVPLDEGFADALRALAEGDRRIRLRPRPLTAEEFRMSVGVCDIVVAPFRRYLHSGSLVYALSAGRPVLTPSTPFAESLAARLASPGWITTYEGRLGPATLAAARRPAAPLDLSPLTPARAASRILDFLEGLARARGEGPARGYVAGG